MCREGEKKFTFFSWKHPNLVGGFDSKKETTNMKISQTRSVFLIGVNMKHIWTSPHWELFATWKLDSASQKKQVQQVIVIGLIWLKEPTGMSCSIYSHPSLTLNFMNFMDFFPKTHPRHDEEASSALTGKGCMLCQRMNLSQLSFMVYDKNSPRNNSEFTPENRSSPN